MRKTSAALALVLGVCVLQNAAAESVRVRVQAMGDNTSDIRLETEVQAAREQVWRWLTDYDHHAGFLPYMSKSRIVKREKPFIFVDQAGTIRILFWSFTMTVRQRITEDPPRYMHFEAVEGDFSRLEGDWNLQPPTVPLSTQLECHLIVRPKRRVPDWAVRMAARYYLRKMVVALAEKVQGQ